MKKTANMLLAKLLPSDLEFNFSKLKIKWKLNKQNCVSIFRTTVAYKWMSVSQWIEKETKCIELRVKIPEETQHTSMKSVHQNISVFYL